MVQRLLNAHGRIIVYDEFPLFAFAAAKQLVADFDAFLQQPVERWRRLSAPDVAARRAELVVGLWRLVSDPDLHRLDAAAASVMGVKTPQAELDFPWYEQVFAAHDLRYLYCLRHPRRVLESLAAMEWMKHAQDLLGTVLEMYAASYRCLRQLEDLAPRRVLVARVDQVAAGETERLAFCGDMLGFLGLAPSPDVRRFAAEWPIVDHWAERRAAGLPEQALDRFRSDPIVEEIAARFGYDLDRP
jgi:hypothetical protein